MLRAGEERNPQEAPRLGFLHPNSQSQLSGGSAECHMLALMISPLRQKPKMWLNHGEGRGQCTWREQGGAVPRGLSTNKRWWSTWSSGFPSAELLGKSSATELHFQPFSIVF